jgi:SAM-dependent methyltransferase
MGSLLQARAEGIADRVFVGGPVKDFEQVGRLQLITLLEQDLDPQSKVLDVGCGCLRGGYWLIHFLDPCCYHGIEPNREMLQAGLDSILEPGLADEKEPAFACNDDFDLDVFDGARFDFVLARSIWTHASKTQIEKMLDSFSEVAADGGVLLASYLRARLFRDYKGSGWVGRSHESDTPGLVTHSFPWIRQACENRGLTVTELDSRELNNQRWLRIEART